MAKQRTPPARDPTAEPTKIIPLRLTDTERITYQKCAERSGLSLSAWIRDRLTQAAQREAKQA